MTKQRHERAALEVARGLVVGARVEGGSQLDHRHIGPSLELDRWVRELDPDNK
jgi:hypothetical protein